MTSKYRVTVAVADKRPVPVMRKHAGVRLCRSLALEHGCLCTLERRTRKRTVEGRTEKVVWRTIYAVGVDA